MPSRTDRDTSRNESGMLRRLAYTMRWNMIFKHRLFVWTRHVQGSDDKYQPESNAHVPTSSERSRLRQFYFHVGARYTFRERATRARSNLIGTYYWSRCNSNSNSNSLRRYQFPISIQSGRLNQFQFQFQFTFVYRCNSISSAFGLMLILFQSGFNFSASRHFHCFQGHISMPIALVNLEEKKIFGMQGRHPLSDLLQKAYSNGAEPFHLCSISENKFQLMCFWELSTWRHFSNAMNVTIDIDAFGAPLPSSLTENLNMLVSHHTSSLTHHLFEYWLLPIQILDREQHQNQSRCTYSQDGTCITLKFHFCEACERHEFVYRHKGDTLPASYFPFRVVLSRHSAHPAFPRTFAPHKNICCSYPTVLGIHIAQAVRLLLHPNLDDILRFRVFADSTHGVCGNGHLPPW